MTERNLEPDETQRQPSVNPQHQNMHRPLSACVSAVTFENVSKAARRLTPEAMRSTLKQTCSHGVIRQPVSVAETPELEASVSTPVTKTLLMGASLLVLCFWKPITLEHSSAIPFKQDYVMLHPFREKSKTLEFINSLKYFCFTLCLHLQPLLDVVHL